jgi:hypothetical protein
MPPSGRRQALQHRINRNRFEFDSIGSTTATNRFSMVIKSRNHAKLFGRRLFIISRISAAG